jgi:hypothetical protein
VQGTGADWQYVPLPTFSIRGARVGAGAYFHRGTLGHFSFSLASAPSDSAAIPQQARFSTPDKDAAAHVSWLDVEIEPLPRGAKRRTHGESTTVQLEWGSIWAGWDSKGGFAAIVLRYGGALPV